MNMDRRSFLLLPVLAPLASLDTRHSSPYCIHRDHVMGTSFDLALWGEAPDLSRFAENAAQAALNEIERLCTILSTYDPASEISRVNRSEAAAQSPELLELLEIYRLWEAKTRGALSVRPFGPRSPLNVDALGKAYILEKSAAIVRQVAGVDGFLNIGGDIAVWGRAAELLVADPAHPEDNADPLTRIRVKDSCAATSGSYARGMHLVDPRTGSRVSSGVSATVVARDAITANALATTLCIVERDEGMSLVASLAGAEALRIEQGSPLQRSGGFSRLEQFQPIRQSAPGNWPAGYEVAISLTVITPDPRLDRSYMAFWIEDTSGKLVRSIVLWGNKTEYHNEMKGFWEITRGNKDLIYKVTRATRAPGNYRVVWNGLDDAGKPVPRGKYRVVVESNRWHGTYAQVSGIITCEGEPANISLAPSVNYTAVTVQYGPRPNQV